MVSMSTRASGRDSPTSRTPSMPSTPGICTSISTTSAREATASRAADAPSAASADYSEVWFGVDDRAQAASDEVLVIGDQHADRGCVHHSFTTGSIERTASTV